MLTTELINENLPDNNIRAILPENIRILFEAVKADIASGSIPGDIYPRIEALELAVSTLIYDVNTLEIRTPIYWSSGSYLIPASSTFTMIHTLNTTQVFGQFAINGNVSKPDIQVKIVDFETINVINITGVDVTGILRLIGFN